MSNQQNRLMGLASQTVRPLMAPVAPMAPPKKIRKPIIVSFGLRPPKKKDTYSNPHPLQVWITIGSERTRFGAVWNNERLLVDPEKWQTTRENVYPLSKSLSAIREYIESVFENQADSGATPTPKSVQVEAQTGQAPEWSDVHGWVYPADKEKRGNANQYTKYLSADSPIGEVYQAYIAHLTHQSGTSGELSHITLGRWQRGLMLLDEFAKQTDQPLPKAGAVTVGWTKRFHTWMQRMPLTKYQKKPISAGQASRFVLKVSSVLTWMIEEDWIDKNPIAGISWPKQKDKEVQFLELEHVHHLLTLNWQGTEGIALWWFNLMCCTGLDYPDAVAYARNRKAFEIAGPEGLKIVGKRKKPPCNEYHMPFLQEVEQLFAKHPTGPNDLSGQCVNRHTNLIETELGIDWRITNKTARKTFGCLMLAAGHRIADVSLMMGHSTIVTTERHYVKVRGASIDRSMARVKVDISQLATKGDVQINPFTHIYKAS